MGKGDKKSKKGKIWKGTYGNSRPRKEKKEGPDSTSEKK
jgi:30S ribosomal protein S31